jgi:hypothetical protein
MTAQDKKISTAPKGGIANPPQVGNLPHPSTLTTPKTRRSLFTLHYP